MHQELNLHDLAADIRALASVMRDIGGWTADLEERVSGLERSAEVDVRLLEEVALVDEREGERVADAEHQPT